MRSLTQKNVFQEFDFTKEFELGVELLKGLCFNGEINKGFYEFCFPANF